MKAYRAEDLRGATQALFTRDTFDEFLLSEAQVKTFCTFSVSGKTERGWYAEEELSRGEIGDSAPWRKIRPFLFSLIRGSRVPESFRITLKLAPAAAEQFLRESGETAGEKNGGFFLNFRYEEGGLTCVSAASLSSFPPDRTLEEAFDRWTAEFFRSHGIAVLEL